MGILRLGFPLGLVAALAHLSTSSESSTWYYDHWCNDEGEIGLEFLDDTKCAKVFPSNFSRDWVCPVPATAVDDRYANESTPFADAPVDTDTLSTFVNITGDVQACLILVKRYDDATTANRRLCFGGGENSAFETWSSSKFIAILNAAGHLRGECGGGLLCSTTKDSETCPLGDLATIVASYDTTQGLTSNSVSSYFNDLGWRNREDKLISEFLGVDGQSLGGNYGEPTPSSLGFTLDSAVNGTCEARIDPDIDGPFENSLTALSLAEAHRRLALHRELQPEDRWPSVEWADAQTLLYGASQSFLFDGLQWGGLTADPAIFIQTGLGNISAIDEAAEGQWRIFSKLGAGYSSSRSVGEIVTAGYGCIPSGPSGVHEFTIAARASVADDALLDHAQDKVLGVVTQILGAMTSGHLA